MMKKIYIWLWMYFYKLSFIYVGNLKLIGGFVFTDGRVGVVEIGNFV